MALQYLDGSTITNFVAIRSSGGDYQGSWSMTNTMRYQQGERSSAVLIGSDGKEMGLQIFFDEIDWASCDPAPVDYSTDEAIMTYISMYLFTGQQGTLVPPTITNMNLILTQPIGLVDNGIDGTNYFALSGTQGRASIVDEAYTQLNFVGDTVSLHAFVSDSSTDTVIEISLCKYDGIETELLTLSILAATNGVAKITGTEPIIASDLLYYKMVVPVGSGTLHLSPITLEVEST